MKQYVVTSSPVSLPFMLLLYPPSMPHTLLCHSLDWICDSSTLDAGQSSAQVTMISQCVLMTPLINKELEINFHVSLIPGFPICEQTIERQFSIKDVIQLFVILQPLT